MAGERMFKEPPRPAWECPRCHRLFEQSFEINGQLINGHPIGHPRLCVPLPVPESLDRDVRSRRANRRGR